MCSGGESARGDEEAARVDNACASDTTMMDVGVGLHAGVVVREEVGREAGSGGLVDNITFEDIVAEGVDVPVSVQMGYKPGPAPTNGTDPGTPHLGRLTVRRLHAVSVFAGELLCLAESPCEGIVLENVTIVTLGMWKCTNAAPSATNTFPRPRCAK